MTAGTAVSGGPSQLSKIWDCRYFWLHLAFADLRSRYRRSYLGLAWSVLQPVLLTILLALVMGKIFGQPVREYAPFVLSGLIVWDFLVQSSLLGCNSFVHAETYIKQFPHPPVIYSLRVSLYLFINMGIALIGLIVWVLISEPSNFGLPWLGVLVALPWIGVIGWLLATIFAYVGVRFRDLPQVAQLLFQAMWYVSTVFISPQVFRDAGVGWVVSYNPVNHVLNLIRAPLLDGAFPTAANVAVTAGSIVVLGATALLLDRRQRDTMIFSL